MHIRAVIRRRAVGDRVERRMEPSRVAVVAVVGRCAGLSDQQACRNQGHQGDGGYRSAPALPRSRLHQGPLLSLVPDPGWGHVASSPPSGRCPIQTTPHPHPRKKVLPNMVRGLVWHEPPRAKADDQHLAGLPVRRVLGVSTPIDYVNPSDHVEAPLWSSQLPDRSIPPRDAPSRRIASRVRDFTVPSGSGSRSAIRV